MRLTDELAARRRLYLRPMATAPAVMVIDIPRKWAGPDLALGRYYPVIIETDDELAEFEAYLAAPRSALVTPDLLALRPSNLAATVITFIEFAPPADGWPWLLICHWPADFVAGGTLDKNLLARGAYTIETYARREQLIAEAGMFARILGADVRVQGYDNFSGVAGNA
jgi:hypothetical protein